MKSLFENQIWPDEISFWKYIQTINSNPTNVSDGVYVIEMDSDIGCVKFQEAFYFETEKDCNHFLYTRDFTYARAVFFIEKTILETRFFEGHEIAATDRLISGIWTNRKYIDLMANLTFEQTQFTREECELAVKELLKVMIIEGKKVS